MDHLLLGCSFSRQVWQLALMAVAMPQLAPSPNQRRFSDWWRRTSCTLAKEERKGINCLIQLVAWHLWKHRNRCLFDGLAPNMQQLLREIHDDAHAWAMAGAAGLSRLI